MVKYTTSCSKGMQGEILVNGMYVTGTEPVYIERVVLEELDVLHRPARRSRGAELADARFEDAVRKQREGRARHRLLHRDRQGREVPGSQPLGLGSFRDGLK